MYDQPPTGRRIGPALIVFLVVLAAVAGAVGYFGTKSVLANTGTPTANGPSHTASAPAGTGASTGGTQGSGPKSTGSQGGPTAQPTRTQVPAGDPATCPQVTINAVAHAGLDSSLSVVLYVRVHRAGEFDSEIWICQSVGGLLVYQGHILRDVLDRATGSNTLLLVEGVKGSVVATADGYTATNPTTNGMSTEYRVTRTKLTTVDEPGDRNPQDYTVIVAAP